MDKLPDVRIEVGATAPEGDLAALFKRLKRRSGPVLSTDEIGRLAVLGAETFVSFDCQAVKLVQAQDAAAVLLR